MRLNLVENHSSICRVIWPIAVFMVISYFLLVYFFTNEELKNIYGMNFYILLGIPMMFAVGYCKLRVYFDSPLKTDLSSGAIEIHEKGLKVKNKEYDLFSLKKVTIQSIGTFTSTDELTKNELLIKWDGDETRHYFQLATIEECEMLIDTLDKILGKHSKLEVSEKIKILMPKRDKSP
jgi:hypothetical protein